MIKKKVKSQKPCLKIEKINKQVLENWLYRFRLDLESSFGQTTTVGVGVSSWAQQNNWALFQLCVWARLGTELKKKTHLGTRTAPLCFFWHENWPVWAICKKNCGPAGQTEKRLAQSGRNTHKKKNTQFWFKRQIMFCYRL